MEAALAKTIINNHLSVQSSSNGGASDEKVAPKQPFIIGTDTRLYFFLM